MKVLMFGWEFPPHISGGLGTACYGLTKGMAQLGKVELTFVVPKKFGGEQIASGYLVSAESINVSKQQTKYFNLLQQFRYFEIASNLVPYATPGEYEEMARSGGSLKSQAASTGLSQKLRFSGHYGKSLFQDISNYARVAATLAESIDFDVIHAHDWLTYPAGIAAKHTSGKPLVVHVHATDFDRSGGNINPDVYKIEKAGMEAADKVIAVSNLTSSIIIEKYGIPAGKVVTVYNAVEPRLPSSSKAINKKLKDKIVTFLGRVTFQKGPEYFIEAASLVLQRMRNVRFVMAGSGDLLHKMILKAAQLKITDRFHFTGFLSGEEVYRMYAMSDVYVMPSVSEPFGISPLEAMQCDVPVIISRQSGVSEILNHVIKVDFWDVHGLADAIYSMLNYGGLPGMIKENGRSEVDHLKWEHAAAQVVAVYESIVNTH